MGNTPFHAGEMALQKRVGMAEQMAQIGDRILRPYMPDQHREFFQTLPMFFVASDDATGKVWASVFYGERGFVESPEDTKLLIHSALDESDPLHGSLEKGKHVGLLGIEPATRRRNRANGVVEATDPIGLAIHVEQSFGNCPKYIQPRAIKETIETSATVAEPFTTFSADIKDRIEQQDTFFIASRGVGKSATTTEVEGGFDISHRGGPAGFVQVIDQSTLIFPDYAGNNFFNTFGNIEIDPQVGLLFIDFERGDHIYLTGTADVLWRQDGPLPIDGVERVVRFELKAGRLVLNASPYLWAKA